MYWLRPRPRTGSVSTWHKPGLNPPSVAGTDIANRSRPSPHEPGDSLTGLSAAPPRNPRWHPLLQAASLASTPGICSPSPAHTPLVLVPRSTEVSFWPVFPPARLGTALVSPRSSPVPGTLYILEKMNARPWGRQVGRCFGMGSVVYGTTSQKTMFPVSGSCRGSCGAGLPAQISDHGSPMDALRDLPSPGLCCWPAPRAPGRRAAPK